MQISSEELQSLENKILPIYDTITRLKELGEELQTRPIIRNTNIWELNSERYRLKHPINIVHCDIK